MEDYFSDHLEIQNAHHKQISSVSLTPVGNRFATAGLDCTVKLWDFSGMAKRIRNFRKIVPVEGVPVVSVCWNGAGNKFLACPYSSSAKVFDREGQLLFSSVAGDMYIKDMRHTKGHVAYINGGCWLPQDKAKFATWGNDSTLRIWDLKNEKRNVEVAKMQNAQNRKYNCGAGAFFESGNCFVAGTNEGNIYIFDSKKLHRPKKINSAHTKGAEIISLLPHQNHTLYSKSSDGVIKQWDIRNTRSPINFLTLPNSNSSPLIWILNRKSLLCTSSDQLSCTQFHFIDPTNLSLNSTRTQNKPFGSAIAWNDAISQTIVSSNRNLCVYFSPQKSSKGALLCQKSLEYLPSDGEEFEFDKEKFYEEINKQKELARNKYHKPAIYKSNLVKRKFGMVTFAEAVVKKSLANNEKVLRKDQNPRDALLRYDKKARENPLFFPSTDKGKNNKNNSQ